MFKENFPIHTLTSYSIGGQARYFFEPKTEEELKKAIEEAKKRNLEFLVIGGGTNLLVDDKGFPGLILKPSIDFVNSSGKEISVGAGTSVADVLDFSAEHGLSGLEWAGGLPGTVGGAVRGNAGAFGGEMKDAVKSVRSLDTKNLREIERNLSECDFGYRSSFFKKNPNDEIILSVVFGLNEGSSVDIRNSIDEKISYRKERHPMEYPNAGSIFKNVDVRKIPASDVSQFANVIKSDPFPVVPAAHIISEAGLKGVSSGGAMISPKHPNFIVNVLGAKSSDVKNLIDLIKSETKKKFGIELEEEIIMV
ncbi:MAG: UDP-N-acetylmuramate dehydrogenase [Candidatus Liptonbacteria bacterium]|nr:UDP-N-acetylmuramate dehydrogenase [Candidatus Liptonbacteria bacterium]